MTSNFVIGYGIDLPDVGDQQEELIYNLTFEVGSRHTAVTKNDDEKINGILMLPAILPVVDAGESPMMFEKKDADQILLESLEKGINTLNLSESDQFKFKVSQSELEQIVTEADYIEVCGF